MQGSQLLERMHRGLERKYEMAINFYKGKEINQILSMDSRYPIYMDFCDTRFISEEFEYLKRVYYYKTTSGKPELPQRMKMICQHYATSPTLSTFTYEYPMMVVTNTKSLFMRRKRRLRKIGAGEGSSDDTEEQEEEFNVFDCPTQYFLEDLDDSSMQERSEIQSQVSYDSEFYEVFADDEKESEVKVMQINLKTDEEDLKGLIQDFTSFGEGQKPNIWEMPSSHLNTAFANIENHSKTPRDSVEITPIQHQDKLKFDKLDKREKKSGIFSQYVDMLLAKPISFSDLGLRFNNPAVQEYNNLPIASEPVSIDNQREERASKRKKIRQKAEELLKRVRNDEANSRPCPQ